MPENVPNPLPENMPDLIPLVEASRLAGKSVKTLRNWVKQGKIDDMRPPDAPSWSPILVRTQQVRGYLVGQVPISKGNGKGRVPTQTPTRPGGNGNGEVAIMRELMDEIRGERDRLRVQVDQLNLEVTELRHENRELRDRARALEREVAGREADRKGIRGLLPGRVRKALRWVS